MVLLITIDLKGRRQLATTKLSSHRAKKGVFLTPLNPGSPRSREIQGDALKLRRKVKNGPEHGSPTSRTLVSMQKNQAFPILQAYV